MTKDMSDGMDVVLLRLQKLALCVPCIPRRHPMNGASPPPRTPKPPPPGPAPPAPLTSPPAPPVQSVPATHPPLHPSTVNGAQKAKKKSDAPVDPAAMYESLKNRIAALEEEEVLEEEEERRFGLHFPPSLMAPLLIPP